MAPTTDADHCCQVCSRRLASVAPSPAPSSASSTTTCTVVGWFVACASTAAAPGATCRRRSRAGAGRPRYEGSFGSSAPGITQASRTVRGRLARLAVGGQAGSGDLAGAAALGEPGRRGGAELRLEPLGRGDVERIGRLGVLGDQRSDVALDVLRDRLGPVVLGSTARASPGSSSPGRPSCTPTSTRPAPRRVSASAVARDVGPAGAAHDGARAERRHQPREDGLGLLVEEPELELR